MNRYILNPINRCLSLIIAPLDTYSGQFTAGSHINVSISMPNKIPVVKQDGFYVFCNLPSGEYEININSDRYFPVKFTAKTSSFPCIANMIPNRRYRLNKGMTWIEGEFMPDSNIYVIPKSFTGYRLLRCDGDIITVITHLPWDLTNRFIAVGDKREICFVKESIGDYMYRLSAPAMNVHEKNSVVAPVSIGHADSSGYMFCLIANMLLENSEIYYGYINETKQDIDYKTIKIEHGRGNVIKS